MPMFVTATTEKGHAISRRRLHVQNRAPMSLADRKDPGPPVHLREAGVVVSPGAKSSCSLAPCTDRGKLRYFVLPSSFFSMFAAACMCAWNAGATFSTSFRSSAFSIAGSSVVVTASMTALWNATS